MILERGDMWSVKDTTDHFLITTNSYIKTNGALVMGRGIAKEARDRYPDLDLRFGRSIDLLGKVRGEYHIVWDWITNIYGFQVKRHYADPADLKLIRGSVLYLMDMINDHDHRGDRFDLNFPGIGNGKLKRKDVLPLLTDLPDCVHIWELPM